MYKPRNNRGKVIGTLAGLVMVIGGYFGYRAYTADDKTAPESNAVQTVTADSAATAPVITGRDVVLSRTEHEMFRRGQEAAWYLEAVSDSVTAACITLDNKDNPRGTLGRGFPALIDRFAENFSGGGFDVSGGLLVKNYDNTETPYAYSEVMITDSLGRTMQFHTADFNDKSYKISPLLMPADSTADKVAQEAHRIGQQAAWYAAAMAENLHGQHADNPDRRMTGYPSIVETVRRKFSTAAFKVSAGVAIYDEAEKKEATYVMVADTFGRRILFRNGKRL